MTLEELIRLADDALSAQLPADSAALAARYAQAFSEWEGQAALAKQPRTELEKLQARHEKVLELVETLAGQAAGDLRKLRQKGKGIRAYLGRRSRSVNVTKPQKG